MVKEGDEMGGMKLLRIGTNRVLVEHEGEKKELTIFSGLEAKVFCRNKRNQLMKSSRNQNKKFSPM